MATKVIKAIVLGACIGVLGYLVSKDIAVALVLGVIWFASMFLPKKK